MVRKGIWGLLVVLLLAACAAPQATVPVPAPDVRTMTVEPEETPTVFQEPTAALPAPPTPTAEVPPQGMAFFRGLSTYDRTRRFVLLYLLDTWQRDGALLRHQAVSGCTLNPQAAGRGLGPEWTRASERATLGDREFERNTFTQEGQAVPGLASYGMSVDESYFLFEVDAVDLDQAGFERCRTDVEAVLATFRPLEPVSGEFAAARAALDVYEPPQSPGQAVTALAADVAEWLSQGNDPANLVARLRTLPKLDTLQPKVTPMDLNGDGRQDVVVQTHLMGLPVVACMAQENGRFVGLALPYSFEEALPTTDSGILVQELTGDERPEVVITYTVQGGSGWTELLYVCGWIERGGCAAIFQASLINWAGPSVWALEPDQAHPGQQQIVLTYPHLYADGFDHKMLNHPLGRQVWRWDARSGLFALAEKTVDLEQSAWEPDLPITVEDRLRWFTNEGETAFRAGEYVTALAWTDRVLAPAASEGWTPADDQPDWAGYARFRHAETLALQRRADEALAEMQAVAANYADDPLGLLAAAFLEGYGDGSAPDAPARGVAAMQAVDLYSHLYYERGEALRFPMDAGGILYPGAGLAAYLDAHPGLDDDADRLLAGLQEAGFAAEAVRLKSAGDEVVAGGEVLVVLRLPDAPNAEGALMEWVLARSAGRWRVMPPGIAEGAPAWPRVGDFPGPTWGPVTLC